MNKFVALVGLVLLLPLHTVIVNGEFSHGCTADGDVDVEMCQSTISDWLVQAVQGDDSFNPCPGVTDEKHGDQLRGMAAKGPACTPDMEYCDDDFLPQALGDFCRQTCACMKDTINLAKKAAEIMGGN